jgi:cytochrome c
MNRLASLPLLAGILLIGILLAGTLPVAPAHAQDAAKGKAQFGQCSACHSLKAGRQGIGPSLHGLFGRAAAAEPKYRYSPALKDAGKNGLIWTEDSLMAYLADPSGFLKKYLKKTSVTNKMPVKFPSPELRRNVIAFLKTATK